jgi:anti-sigma factor ChrR (cupin superfamily)
MSMRRVRSTLIVLAAAATIAAGTAGAQTAEKAKPAAKPAAAAPKHVMVSPSDVKWGPGPPSLPPGAQMAVLDGDPAMAGKPFVIRAKFPDGYRVQPHWHPADENVVVLSGSFSVGIGDKFDEGSMMALAPGGYAKMPKMTHHYATAKGETVIQVHGMGPFAVTYVNPADDPRNKK